MDWVRSQSLSGVSLNGGLLSWSNGRQTSKSRNIYVKA
jgi:hypothetical protein